MTKNTTRKTSEARMYVLQCRDAKPPKCDHCEYACTIHNWTHLCSCPYDGASRRKDAYRKAMLSQEWFADYLKSLGHNVQIKIVNMTKDVCLEFKTQFCDPPGSTKRLGRSCQTIPVPGVRRDGPLGTCARQFPMIHEPHRWAKDAGKRTQWLDANHAPQE